MPALVQAVTTSYMQDGKQVLELIYIYIYIRKDRVIILYIMCSISNLEVFEQLFGAHGGDEGICQEQSGAAGLASSGGAS